MAERRLADISADPQLRELARQRHRDEAGRRITRDATLQEGRNEGQGNMLRRILVDRFGPFSAQQEQMFAQATPGDLLRWADGVFEAASLDDLLRGPR